MTTNPTITMMITAHTAIAIHICSSIGSGACRSLGLSDRALRNPVICCEVEPLSRNEQDDKDQPSQTPPPREGSEPRPDCQRSKNKYEARGEQPTHGGTVTSRCQQRANNDSRVWPSSKVAQPSSRHVVAASEGRSENHRQNHRDDHLYHSHLLFP